MARRERRGNAASVRARERRTRQGYAGRARDGDGQTGNAPEETGGSALVGPPRREETSRGCAEGGFKGLLATSAERSVMLVARIGGVWGLKFEFKGESGNWEEKVNCLGKVKLKFCAKKM